MKKLSKKEQGELDFARAYVSNNRKASKAYLELHPKANDRTCRTEGSKMAKRETVQELIRQIQEEKAIKFDKTIDSQIQRLEELFSSNGASNDFKLRVIQEENKLLGFYEEGEKQPSQPTFIYDLSELTDEKLDRLDKITSKLQNQSGKGQKTP